MVDLREVIGPNVRAERARLGLRQADLAERVGIPRATLADIEAGRRRVYLDEVSAILDALGITLDELLRGAPAEVRRALLGE